MKSIILKKRSLWLRASAVLLAAVMAMPLGLTATAADEGENSTLSDAVPALFSAEEFILADTGGESSVVLYNGIVPAANVQIAVKNPSIEMTKRDRHVVVVTYAGLTASDPQTWADSLTWHMTREAEDSPMWKYDAFTKSQFKNIYTGDLLDNWRIWAATTTSQPARLFGEFKTTGSAIGSDTVVQFAFTNDYFLGSATTTGNRNAAASFLGEYDLIATSGSALTNPNIIAAAKVDFRPYASYRTFAEVRGQLESLKIKAQAKGYEFNIVDYGTSTGGYDQYAVIFGKPGKSNRWLQLSELAETNPAQVQKDLANGLLNDVALPIFLNNIHPDECPGSDAQINFLSELIANDYIDYSYINGYAPGVSDPGGYTTKVIQEWSHNYGRIGGSQGAVDVRSTYTTADDRVNVDALLNDVFFIISPNENPDGRTANGRRNANGFDLNRDTSFQTQLETYYISQFISKWNPVAFLEFHGFVSNFLVEPCTPPHEPNLEYDLLIEKFYKGGEAFGNAALGSVKDKYPRNAGYVNFSKYVIPLRDYFSSTAGWDAWDDFSTNYTPSYAMINSHAMGYTIEIPYNNEGSVDLLVNGMYGFSDFVADNKREILNGQLEFFRRGVENIDVSVEPGNKLETYYVDGSDNVLAHDVWRPKYNKPGETGKFFPEYYVIPVDPDAQRNPAGAAAIEDFLLRNDVKLKELNKDTTIDGALYKAGTLIVDMHQGKREYANAVLWDGVDASFYTGLYSESVVSHPKLRGFDCIGVAKLNAIPEGNLSVHEKALGVSSTISGNTKNPAAVVIKNNGTEAVRAINKILADGKDAGYITSGPNTGHFLVDIATFDAYKDDFTLVGIGVTKATGDVYKLKEPKVYLPGVRADYEGSLSTNPYFSAWFADGFGSNLFIKAQNSPPNEAYLHDIVAYREQMGFKVVETPAEASIIVGSRALNDGLYGAQALSAVRAGKPYVSTGASPLSILRGTLMGTSATDSLINYSSTSSAESLHYVSYPSASAITAPKVSSGDDIIYNFGGGYFTKIPAGATVLIRAKTMADKFHIAGCFPNVSDSNLGGKVEAFAYQGKDYTNTYDLDVTAFATSITRKAHQQDDYLFVSNTIYSKSLDELWTPYCGTAFSVHPGVRANSVIRRSFQLNFRLDLDYEFVSSNPLTATVDQNGLVQCLKVGTVVISARSKDGSMVSAVVLNIAT